MRVMCIRTGLTNEPIRVCCDFPSTNSNPRGNIQVIEFNSWGEVFTFILTWNPTKIEVRFQQSLTTFQCEVGIN